MATNYPTSLQDLDATRGTAGQATNSPSHSTHHQTEDDTLEAVQARVGITDSAVTTSLDYRIAHGAVENIYNVKRYGATGDGTTDDGPAIRSAITAGAGKTVYLPAGTYRINTSDGASPTHALLLNTIGTRLVGEGSSPDAALTTINITVSGLIWGVAVTAGHCEVSHIRIQFTGTTAPYWLVGEPGIPGSSVHSCVFEDIHAQIMSGADIPVPPTTTNDATHSNVGAGIFAFGPEYPTTTNFDCAGNSLEKCIAYSAAGSAELVSGFIWGNGTVGNVLANDSYACQAILCTNGVVIAGGSMTWYGGQFSQNTSKDINLVNPPNERLTFYGVRGESGKQVLSSTITTGIPPKISLIGCYFGGYSPTSPTAGEMVTFDKGCLTLIDVRLGTLSANAKIVLNTASTSAPAAGYYYAQLVAIRVDMDNQAGFPVGSHRVRSVINIGSSEDGFPTRTYQTFDGLNIAEATNGKQGVTTLVGGTATVSNASVTANSRIFLCCQTPGGTPGFLRVSARTAATSFTILSSSGSDTSVVAWEMFEPA